MRWLWWHIRRIACRHDWVLDRYQALVGGTTYTCPKCGLRARRER